MRALKRGAAGQLWRFTIATMLVLGLAPTLASNAAAQATTFTESVTVPITPGFVSCEGETVFLSGDVHILLHRTIDAANGVHTVLEENFAGIQGFGVVSGARYIATDSKQEIFNGKPDAAREDTFQRTAQLVAQGGLSNVQLHVIGHLTTNANGETTVDFVTVRAECQP